MSTNAKNIFQEIITSPETKIKNTSGSSMIIYKKMSEVMKEIGFIGKDQKNASQGFKFRGIDDVMNALYPALNKHNVFMVPSCIEETHELREVERSSGKKGVDKYVHIKMQYTFYAEDGSCVTAGPIPAEGLDSGDKATNKALSAALKYALIQTFSIPTKDMEEGDSTTIEASASTATATPQAATSAPKTFSKPAPRAAAPAQGSEEW